MANAASAVQSFGVCSALPPVLRILAQEAQYLNNGAAALVRGCDELEEPARRRVLAWAELVRDASATLRRELEAASGELRSDGTLRPSRGVEL